MSVEEIDSLIEIIQAKQKSSEAGGWTGGSRVFLSELRKELIEVESEMSAGRACYLEDELGDVLWDYLNLLLALESEGQISASRVFSRSLEKYRERVNALANNIDWETVKSAQKEKLKKEHEENL